MNIKYADGFKKANINPADLLDCLNDLLSDVNRKFIDCHTLTIKSYEIEDDPSFSSMCSVKIAFVKFVVPAENVHYEWKTYRDKNFHCCSGRGFKEILK